MRHLFLLALVACAGPAEAPDEAADTAPMAPWPVETTVPITGGTVAISPDGSLAAAADIGHDQVHLIDLDTGEELASYELERGSQPARLLVHDDGTVLVALRGVGAVAHLDPAGGEELARHSTCPSPRGLTRDGADTWLACASGELVRLDTATGAVLDSTFVEYDLRDVVVDGDQLLVSTFKRAELLTLDRDGTLLERRRPPVFDSSVHPDDTGDWSFSANAAWRTVAHPEGGALMFHQRGLDDEIPPAPPSQTYYGQDIPRPGDPRPGCGGLVHSSTSRFPSSGQPSSSGILAYAWLPVDGTVLPDGRAAVVAAAANPDTNDSADLLIHDEEAFAMVEGSCVYGELQQIDRDSQLVAVAAATDGTLVTVGRSPFSVQIDGAPVALTAPPAADDPEKTAFEERGFDLFHRDASTGMTCASCHLEGQDDGRTWVFNEVGARRTQSMAGGLGATAPFHWGAEFENFAALMDEVLVRRMGLAAYESEDVQALAYFMEGLQPTAVTPRGDAEAIATGEALFHDIEVGCANCHSGELFTSNVNADVGTGAAFQVPSLVGVGYRFPYLHDGCADTLYDRFTPACDDGSHGDWSGLSQPEIDALVAYLQSL